MTADPWHEARRELDLWADLGLTARFWVRDDDACEMSEHLARLHALARKHAITIGLAVIPGKLRPSLLDYLNSDAPKFHPMCHGWKHINYGPWNKPAEFGRDRPLACLIEDAQAARQVFCRHFGTQPIFVPPFNRISYSLTRALPKIGFVAVSAIPSILDRTLLRLKSRFAWGPLVSLPRASAIPRIDVHIDPIDWTSQTALDARAIAGALAQQLRARRTAGSGAASPIGLLTHHLVHDEAIWRLCDGLLDVLRPHQAVEFIELADWPNRRAVGAVD
jgi:peptidoglycan/xylan/chitin deacetylase (PgdA/CDA1 family)